ncbi:MAG: phosphocholine cytidylyltransferase family protein [Candidatus Hydrogenedentes bacterium]|nr:phosphocholine cytidylyltransferase family protein [Candidatus Hydrogenedentota bacterium]
MDYRDEHRITTACLLAAGTGSRLHPLTDCRPKCLTEIDGIPMLERLVHCLIDQGIKRLVVVVGHLEGYIREFLKEYEGALEIEYVVSPVYATTNNIYSLWLARKAIQEPFILVESDLVFDAPLLRGLLYPDRIAVSHILPWMNGTTITMNSGRMVSAFNLGIANSPINSRYKTVNICSLSEASWQKVGVRLDAYISAGRVNEYYEVVFEEMIADGSLSFECVFFDTACWYEVDTLDDLHQAERMSWKHRRTTRPALLSGKSTPRKTVVPSPPDRAPLLGAATASNAESFLPLN